MLQVKVNILLCKLKLIEPSFFSLLYLHVTHMRIILLKMSIKSVSCLNDIYVYVCMQVHTMHVLLLEMTVLTNSGFSFFTLFYFFCPGCFITHCPLTTKTVRRTNLWPAQGQSLGPCVPWWSWLQGLRS